METVDPVENKKCLNKMKAEGQEELWRATVGNWLKPGLIAKFTQNKPALDFLMSTGTREIGEASMNDYWGIGWKLSDDKVLHIHSWKGKNTLGVALMEVRENLRERN